MKMKSISIVIAYCRSVSKTILLFCLLNSFLLALAPYLTVILISQCIDILQSGGGTDALISGVIRYIVFLGILRTVQIILAYFYNMEVNQSGMKTGIKFGFQMLHAEFFQLEDSTVRDEQAKIRAQIGVGAIVSEVISPLLGGLFSIVLFGYSLLKISPLLVLCLIMVTLFRMKNINELERKKQLQKRNDGVIARCQDYLFKVSTDYKWAKEIKCNDLMCLLQSKYHQLIEKANHDIKELNRGNLFNRITECFFEILSVLTDFGLPILLFILKKIDLSQFSLIINSGNRFSGGLRAVLEKSSELQIISEAIKQYDQFDDNLQLVDSGEEQFPLECSPSNLKIEFKDVSFRYPNASNYVLKNINFTIHAHEKIALIGLNGAGKSTIIHLLSGFYTPESGEILINGVSLSHLDKSSWRKNMSVLLQGFQLFALPVWKNICLSQPYDKDKAERVTMASGIASKLKTLDKEWNSEVTKILSDEGVEFSGGEAQKLATARAFYKDAPFLILDEPTSALDPLAEERFFRGIDGVTNHQTVLFITHRLSSVKLCDRVVVLNNGICEEVGSHEELVQRKGVYADLFQKQAEYYV